LFPFINNESCRYDMNIEYRIKYRIEYVELNVELYIMPIV